MKWIFILVAALHGAIHLLGFLKAFNLATVDQLSGSYPKPVGLAWLLAALLFLGMAILYAFNVDWWWKTGLSAIVLSQILILMAWGDAKFGTVANMILLLPVIMALAADLPTSYRNIFRAEAEKGLNRYTKQGILTEEDITHLPAPVQSYIRYSGAIGKEKINHFRVVFRGQFRTDPDSKFRPIQAVQYNFFDKPTRLFYMKASYYGVPMEGLHLYIGTTATMQIKLAHLFEVVSANGPELNKSETVTMLNDICFLAPAALIDDHIAWEPIDSMSARAIYTIGENTVSATLYFNETGELVNFSSDDRAASVDGEHFEYHTWTTPLADYRDFNGRRLASYGEAIWHQPGGEYCYGKFTVQQIDYNYTGTNIDEPWNP